LRGLSCPRGGGSQRAAAGRGIRGWDEGRGPPGWRRAMRPRGTEAGGRNGSPVQSSSLLAALLAALLLLGLGFGLGLGLGIDLAGPDVVDRADGQDAAQTKQERRLHDKTLLMCQGGRTTLTQA